MVIVKLFIIISSAKFNFLIIVLNFISLDQKKPNETIMIAVELKQWKKPITKIKLLQNFIEKLVNCSITIIVVIK